MTVRNTPKFLIVAGVAALSLVACQPAEPSADAATPDADEPEVPGDPRANDDGLSVYTTVDLEVCDLVRTDPESEGRTWSCEGHAGIPLLAHDGDGRFDLDAGVPGGWSGIGPFNTLSDTVEWRGPPEAPYAIIYRLRSAAPELPNASWLIVESIGTEARPGCVVARVDGATPFANVRAREDADRLAPSFNCDTDQPAGVSD